MFNKRFVYSLPPILLCHVLFIPPADISSQGLKASWLHASVIRLYITLVVSTPADKARGVAVL